jgi:hypothetical protein
VIHDSKQAFAEHFIQHPDVMRQNCRPKTKLASQQERMCSVSFSLFCSPLEFGRAMKNTNLNAQHSNFKKLIFQVVLLGETEALI